MSPSLYLVNPSSCMSHQHPSFLNNRLGHEPNPGRQIDSSEHSASFRTTSGLVRLPLAARRMEIAQLTTTIQDDIKGIMNTYLDDFAANSKYPKITNLITSSVDTGDHPRAFIPPHKYHPHKNDLVDREIDEMVRN